MREMGLRRDNASATLNRWAVPQCILECRDGGRCSVRDEIVYEKLRRWRQRERRDGILCLD